MNTVAQILDTLDHSNDGRYCSFVSLNEAYTYLLDARLNLFRDEEQWAVAIERLGYNPRGGSIGLDIFYYGNCLINLEEYNGKKTNLYGVDPILWEFYLEATANEVLNPAAESVIVRGIPVKLTHNRAAYEQIGIDLIDSKEIFMQEVGRLLIHEHPELFRATDKEVYKLIPVNLKKILVLDEWYHRDYAIANVTEMSPTQVEEAYEISKASLEKAGIGLDKLTAILQTQNEQLAQQNHEVWTNDRPSSYETWQQLAAVLATGNIRLYQPTLAPNTHWRYWPESGSL